MPIPIGDDNTGRRITPVVNYLLIALNVFVFFYWQRFGSNIALRLLMPLFPERSLPVMTSLLKARS